MQSNNNQNQLKKGMIVLGVMGFLIFAVLILMALLNDIQSNRSQKANLELTEGFHSIKEVLKYYGCRLIKTKDSKEEGFVTDIYTDFKYDLYENEKSNEEFYQNLIKDMAKFLNYSNFRLLDESKDIEIRVMGNKDKIKKILINGMEDYFIYMDSQMSLRDYKEIPLTEFSVEAPELVSCLENQWSTKVDFGTRETIFQDYYIYFDEGIEVRKVSGKIYNVVFTKNYVKSIINGFTVSENHDIIIRELGKPTFQNEEKNIIGYKGKEMYVFFEEDQISVYRNIEEQGFDEFFALVDEFLAEKTTLLEFMNELTYLWPDYEEYTYDAETVFLSYPNKGIDIKMNYENTNGIVLYNNIGVSQERVNPYLEHTEFMAILQLDNVYNAEVRRVSQQLQFSEKCQEYKQKYEAEDTKNRGKNYDYYMKMSGNDNILCTYFISQNPAYPNCELSENIESYIWMNEDCFIYSVANKGIYYYDLKNQKKGVIITGKEEFEIKSCENQILKYNDSEIELKI